MIKMYSNGIMIEVPEGEVSFYQRAGYSVVIAPAPVEPVDETPPAPVEPKTGKKK
jgi:hypothetical protein